MVPEDIFLYSPCQLLLVHVRDAMGIFFLRIRIVQNTSPAMPREEISCRAIPAHFHGT